MPKTIPFGSEPLVAPTINITKKTIPFGSTPIKKSESVIPEEKKASGGFLGFMTPALSTLPQAVGLWLGSKEMAKSAESISSNMQKNADLSFQTLKKLQTTKDPIEKEKLSKLLKDIAKTNQELSGYMGEVVDTDKLTKATAIKIPGGIADIPGLSTEPKRAAQQIAGRSIAQLGVSTPGLGAAGMGTVMGAGRGLEAGKDIKGIATEAALTGLTFKAGGALLGKVAEVPVVQKALESPIGKIAAKATDKIFSPFMAKTSAPGTLGAEVDKQVANFGKAIDKLYSPSTYLQPIETFGQKVGILRTPEEKLQDAYQKVEDFWQGYKNGYKSLVKYDTNSPKILAREGIGATQSGNSLITTEGQEALKMKIGAEHSVLNEAIRKSGLVADINKYRAVAEAQIISNTKAGEQVKALANFRREWQAYLNQNRQYIFGNNMPLELLNNFKSYSWSQGYASKIGPKIDSINAKANRLAGNAAKNYINGVAQTADKNLAEGIILTNQRSAELQEALKFLEAMNGNKVAYGKIGRHFARLLGAVVGSQGGALGSVAGTLTADQLIAILQNPKYSIGQAMILIQQAAKNNPQIMNQLSRYIYEQSIVKPMIQKTLQAGSQSRIAIPLEATYPRPGKPFEQMGKPVEPTTIIENKIPKTPDVLFRKELPPLSEINNNKLYKRYNKTLPQNKLKILPKKVWIHATSKEAAKSIKKEGFNVKKYLGTGDTTTESEPVGVYFHLSEKGFKNYANDLELAPEDYINRTLIRVEPPKNLFKLRSEAEWSKVMKDSYRSPGKTKGERITNYLKSKGYEGIEDSKGIISGHDEPQGIIFDPKL